MPDEAALRLPTTAADFVRGAQVLQMDIHAEFVWR
jgi:hypothetical protein